METAAKSNLKRVTLELGGKSPIVVFPDVDSNKTMPFLNCHIKLILNTLWWRDSTTVNEAVSICHRSIFVNMGQACCAGSRTYVHSDIYDEFVKQATAMASKRKLGNPFEAGIEQGPQVSASWIQPSWGKINLSISSLLSRLVSFSWTESWSWSSLERRRALLWNAEETDLERPVISSNRPSLPMSEMICELQERRFSAPFNPLWNLVLWRNWLNAATTLIMVSALEFSPRISTPR